MSDRTDHVLDLIDGALDGYTSPDAMRWIPEEHRDEQPSPSQEVEFGVWFEDWLAEEYLRIYEEPPTIGAALVRPVGIVSAVPQPVITTHSVLGDIYRLFDQLLANGEYQHFSFDVRPLREGQSCPE